MRPADEYMELRQQRSHHGVLQRYRIASRLQRLASIAATHRRPQRPSYLSLPAQIRNKIIKYVLLPGDIHIRAAKKNGVKAKVYRVWDELRRFPNGGGDREFLKPPPPMPGFQILATCKSIYGLYHERFYALNTFFLPPGPLDETLKHFFKHLQPEHVNMISRVGIRLGVEDLTPAGFKDVEDFMSRVRRCSLAGERRVGREWADTVHLRLLHIWYEKLAFLRKIRGLKMVKVVAVGVAEGEEEEVFEIDGLDLESALEVTDGSSDEIQFRAGELTALVRDAAMAVKREVEERVDTYGWRVLKAWANGGGGGFGLGCDML